MRPHYKFWPRRLPKSITLPSTSLWDNLAISARRYPDKAAHDVERAAAIQMVDDVTATAEKRIAELKQQHKAFEVEMEFYKRDPNKAPMALRRKIAENEDSIAEQQRFIAGQDQEKRRVHQRFDAELAQLRKLWESQRLPAAAAGAAAETPAASR